MSQKAERGFWDTHDAIEILSCPDGYGALSHSHSIVAGGLEEMS